VLPTSVGRTLPEKVAEKNKKIQFIFCITQKEVTGRHHWNVNTSTQGFRFE
jgi:hypothetical protein